MPIGLFAKKVGMTQIFDESGTIHAVTLLKSEECQVSQIKTSSTDGYNSVQLAYGAHSVTKLTRPHRGHLEKNCSKPLKAFAEFRVDEPSNFNLGQDITLDLFPVGQKIKVTGKSIGKGFSGNQKRHNFSRGPMTHGSKNHRLPGSIGAGSTPGRVYPGKKMAGHLGGTLISTNSEVMFVNTEEEILVIKGSVPGKKNTILKIQLIN